MRHEVKRQLALVGAVGFTTRERRVCASHSIGARTQPLAPQLRAARHSTPASRYVVVHPGATAASRRYPAERFAAAADLVARAQRTRHRVHRRRPASARCVERGAAGDAQAARCSLAAPLDLGELGGADRQRATC